MRLEVERQLLPHKRQLEVPRAEQELTGVKGPLGDVADPPVRLNDGVSIGEGQLDGMGDMRNDLREQRLVLSAEGKRVAVAVEPVDEVLGEVRPPRYAELGVETKTTGIETDGCVGPGTGRGLPLCLRLGGLALNRGGLPQQFRPDGGGKVLEHPRVRPKPVIGWIEVLARWVVAALRDRDEVRESALERWVDRWTCQLAAQCANGRRFQVGGVRCAWHVFCNPLYS